MAKKAVTEEQLEIPTGKGKHTRLLERFVEQQGDAAIGVLERCLDEGSPKMRSAAWELLAAQAVAVAERRALAGAAGAEGASKKQRAAQLEGLRRVATPVCVERLAQLAEALDFRLLSAQG